MYFGIWCHEDNDWLRETNEWKAKSILVFETKKEAEHRAAVNYGFDSYYELVENGWVDYIIC